MMQFVSAQDIQLPTPQKTGGKPLMEAINLRRSNRNFSDKALDMQTISNLVWVAYGYNRENMRVVPSANNKQEFEIYIALKSGIYLYDAKEHKLILKLEGDHRRIAGRQEFVAVAPLNFIYVMNKEIADMPVDCGFIAQNVYLYCASEGLTTVVRGFFDQQLIKSTLNLGEKQQVVLCQTVGYQGD
ncbi:MAG: SagB/ThcOx family dehydrogenase [Dysgonamonadaceae bacterium]|nr:SagB/ThcOx family dehydrogenase [Dysgonamonadaceae bacterium]